MDRVELTKTQSEFIAERTRQFRTEADSKSEWLAPHVERTGYLPLFVGFVDSVGIDEEGRVRQFSADGGHIEYDGVKLPDSRELFLAALVSGAKKYPQLATLVPPRPASATTCTECGGKGWKSESLICKCGGVGWRE